MQRENVRAKVGVCRGISSDIWQGGRRVMEEKKFGIVTVGQESWEGGVRSGKWCKRNKTSGIPWRM